jgi:hypothetical protein
MISRNLTTGRSFLELLQVHQSVADAGVQVLTDSVSPQHTCDTACGIDTQRVWIDTQGSMI